MGWPHDEYARACEREYLVHEFTLFEPEVKARAIVDGYTDAMIDICIDQRHLRQQLLEAEVARKPR